MAIASQISSSGRGVVFQGKALTGVKVFENFINLGDRDLKTV
ncbi:hypothetical protein [Komarekiella delphini-convector]